MFNASISGSDKPLVISSAVVESVLDLIDSTSIYSLSPKQLLGRLQTYSNDGIISISGFRALFPGLPPSHSLFTIFGTFDRTDSGSCDVSELAIGLCVLCHGSKSSKLAFAFDVLDDDADELLTRRGLWRFILSFLTSLLAVGQFHPPAATKRDIARVLDSISVATASEILATGKSQKVSFATISDWYAEKGFRDSSWIELLDIRKWVPVLKREAEREDEDEVGDEEEEVEEEEKEEEEEEEGGGEEEEDDDDDDDERYVYSAALLLARPPRPAPGNGRIRMEQHSLLIKASDTMRVFAVSRASGLDTIDSSDLVSLLKEYEGPDGCIQARNFQHFLQNFVVLEDLAAEVRNGLVKTLFQIFRAFEENSNFENGADIRTLSMGLALFCSGNKSNKLGTGFSVFDVQQLGYLTESSLSSFLSSILLLLTALGSIEHASIAFAAADYVSNEICRSTGSDMISFGAFGEWYVSPHHICPLPTNIFLKVSPQISSLCILSPNLCIRYNAEGFQIASWIELLNLQKWTTFTPGTSYQDDDNDGEDGEDGEVRADEDEGAFSISLHGPEYERVLDVTKGCALEVLEYKRNFSQHSANFQTFVIHLVDVSRDGLIQKSEYEAVLRRAGIDIRASLHGSGSFMMRFFDAFDRSSSGFADIVELVTGSTVLFDGSKSSKLMFAYSLFDDQKSGSLSKSEMWRFFRSFLTAILLLTALPPSDKFFILVDEAAEWVVQDMLEYIGEDQDSLTFDDLSLYYSGVGFRGCSWIELLDLSKWGVLLA